MYGMMSLQVEARNCKLHDNRAGRDGALFAAGASSLRISQCSFINNTATRGAAIICAISSKVTE
jgi:predicted outer membrane repeat protein